MTSSRLRCDNLGGKVRTNNLGDNAENDAVEHIRPQSENKTETKTNRPEEADGRVLGTE